LEKSQYVKFVAAYRAEPTDRTLQPVPSQPGLRHENEASDLKDLRPWQDERGAGWIVSTAGKTAWFSIKKWGSWRLAYLLARLQRTLWIERRGAPEASAKKGASGRGRPKRSLEAVPKDKAVPQAREADSDAQVHIVDAEQPGDDSPQLRRSTDSGQSKRSAEAAFATTKAAHASPATSVAKARIPTRAELQELAASKRLVDFVRAKKWPSILSPAWEGQRWKKLLEEVAKGALSEAALVDEVVQKLRRQVSGEKLTNSRLQRAQRLADEKERMRREAERVKAAKSQHAAFQATWQVPGCTCGHPIHTERCKLFRPEPHAAAETAGPSRYHGQQDQQHANKQPPPSLPSPMSQWAHKEVSLLAAEIASQPAVEQKVLWKKAMLRYHPDKRQMQSELGAATATDRQLAEVLMEVKRRYESL